MAIIMNISRCGRRGLLNNSSMFTLLIGLGFVTAANAQTVPDTNSTETVTVSATRVDRQGYSAPTPTTVISSEQLDAQASTNLADVVNQMPSLVASTTPESVNGLVGSTAGMNLLNLRALGANRTLVLVDGARPMPSNASLNVDLNLLPTELVQRVDVVTGGASADWGSDAVAGVVNFILDKNFNGFKAFAQAGESQYSDGQNVQAGATYGTDLFGGRGHFEISGKYNYVGAVNAPLFSGRSWYNGSKVLGNPNGSATDILLPNVGLAAGTDGGVVTAGALKGTQFVGPNGTPAPFNFGFVSGQESVNGSAEDDGGFLQLGAAQTEGNVFGRLSYDLTSNVTAYAELTFAKSDVISQSTPYNRLGSVTINSGNAYLPSSVQALMTAQNIPSFTLGKVNRNLGYVTFHLNSSVANFRGGLSGEFGDGWNWDAYFQHGQNSEFDAGRNMVNVANYNNAINAVLSPATGQVVCQSSLAAPTNGCQPLDPFGTGAVPASTLNYVRGIAWQNIGIQQDDFAANLRGTPFATWAGDVSLATGFEYRREAYTVNTDPISQVSGWSTSQGTPASGSYTVAEGYVETVVPLLSNAALAKEFDFNGAIRATGYSLSGVSTAWKVGATWQVTDDLKFRGLRSTDIRAPNLQDLFATGITQTNVFSDPVANSSYQILQVTTGSTKLTPEIAITKSVGAVYEPSFIPNLSGSIDYFNIKIGNAIVTPPGQTIINQCVQGSAVACSYIVRGANGLITSLKIAPLNIQDETTSGIDFAINYKFDVADVISDWGGTVSLNALATDTIDHTINLLGSAIQYAGTDGDGAFADPSWTATFNQTYTTGPLSLNLSERFISSGVITNRAPIIVNNYVPAIVYVNLGASYTLNDGLQVYGIVDNIANQAPPASPAVATAPHLNLGVDDYIYDVIGRRFRVGLRYQF